MLTDWPDSSKLLLNADLHHITVMCARDNSEKLTNAAFQDAIKELYEKKDGLNEWQLRLLEWYILELRAGAWEKWISKASFEHDFYNNSINIEELRHNNDGLAKTLGYASVSEHRLANKMASSPDTVRSFIQALERRIRPVFMDRMEAWRDFAQQKLFMSGDLLPHDLFYVCPKEAEAHYDVNTLNLMNHFPFWPTFNNATTLLNQLFNIEFTDITNSGLERAHPDAKIFSVKDNKDGTHLGRLYLDPYARENKHSGWNTLLARTAAPERGLDKIVYLIGSVVPPVHDAPSLLHYEQLQDFLFQLGKVVQLLVSRSPYRDISIPWAPFYASDWDAADMFPVFCQFFVTKPGLLQALSSPDYKSSAPLSYEQAECASLALSRGTLFDTYRTLFWADFDLTLFEMEERKQKFWLDLYREMHKEYFP
ncbi:unnamed protein product, partial [Mesorhabditis belari]|uniref:Peptidase M3A/M3B catalytic domain-containing protein n=1 Tax=Mesorhabditis belari TaxID=2138241 RepID=A0AAF3FPD6_9BILA